MRPLVSSPLFRLTQNCQMKVLLCFNSKIERKTPSLSPSFSLRVSLLDCHPPETPNRQSPSGPPPQKGLGVIFSVNAVAAYRRF